MPKQLLLIERSIILNLKYLLLMLLFQLLKACFLSELGLAKLILLEEFLVLNSEKLVPYLYVSIYTKLLQKCLQRLYDLYGNVQKWLNKLNPFSQPCLPQSSLRLVFQMHFRLLELFQHQMPQLVSIDALLQDFWLTPNYNLVKHQNIQHPIVLDWASKLLQFHL